jgi:cysteine sulfinate desulfinase/cysteine desulfurase-like protein
LGEPWPAWPLIYLDHNATTPIAPEVLDAMMPYLCIALGKEGYRVTYLPVDREDLLKIADLEAAISDETAVLCLMWANNETGLLFPRRAGRADLPVARCALPLRCCASGG